MNGLNCVKGEIHNVLAQLRITGRSRIRSSIFDFGTHSPNIESLRHKLLASLKELHLFLGFHSDLHEIDSVIWLRPFLDVILSDIRGVDIMNVTLTSVHKFLLYCLIDDQSINCTKALHDILYAMSNAKFDQHSRSDSELIHIRLMEVFLETMRCPAGYLLSDANVCLCVQKCFELRKYHSISSVSTLMVRYTENVLIQMMMLVFGKLAQPLMDQQQKQKQRYFTTHASSNTMVTDDEKVIQHSSDIDIKNDMKGFGARSMCRILRYLTYIINPNQIDTSPDLREFGLRLINVTLETAGTHLNNYPSLIHIICDDLCRQLLANSQSHHFGILSYTLRVIFDLFNAVKEAIRVQLEVFFISIHLRIAESDSSSFEQKELVLESIVEFCREPSLIVGLYTNYDCQVGYTDLFEDLCKFLSMQATPASIHHLNELHLIAAEGILAIIDCIARKFCNHSITGVKHKKINLRNTRTSNNSYHINMNEHNIEHDDINIDTNEQQEMDDIREQQRRKRKLKLAAKYFNEKGGKSLKDLQTLKVIENPLNASNIALFLHENPYLDKTQIGVFLGKNAKLNGDVLNEYISRFDFKCMRMDEALRLFLESFVLRGEAQTIERIIEKFSSKVFDEKSTDSPLQNTDAAFLLAYSIIQLNTDAHNNQIKNKMSFKSYKQNLKGCNDKQDFPEWYLNKIYCSITHCEIKIRTGNPRDIFANKNASYYDLYQSMPALSNISLQTSNNNNNNQSIDSSTSIISVSTVVNDNASVSGNDTEYERENSTSSTSSLFFDHAYHPPLSSATNNVKEVKKSEWMHVLKKSQVYGKFSTIAPPSNGAQMFNILWSPALNILAFHLRYARHPKVLDRIMQV